MSKRKILIFTGSRAEYGLQYPILQAVQAHPQLSYQLFVAGSHFDQQLGNTSAEIAADGWEIHAQRVFTLADDAIAATPVAIGQGILLSSEVYRSLRPDVCVIYGDRFEAFAALIASTQMGIPTAHIEGGDITRGGTLDDSVRHAMSMLAHLHFVTNVAAAERLIHMGEEPWRVINVGYPGNDLIYTQQYASADELCMRYQLRRDIPILLFTQHPLPISIELSLAQLDAALHALHILSTRSLQIIITYANSDAGSRRMIERLHAFVQQHPQVQLHANVGRYDYHGLLAMISKVSGGVCLGNSSSGIKETPALGCPVVNIGDRQAGRLHADNVLHVEAETAAVVAAVESALDEVFIQRCRMAVNPYGNGGSGARIADILATIPLDLRLLRKASFL